MGRRLVKAETQETVVQESDGCTLTTRIDPDGVRHEERRSAAGQIIFRASHFPRTEYAAGKTNGLADPPAIRTNAIPGEKARRKYDPVLGRKFESRGEYDRYLKQNNLVELGRGDLPQAPSHAELPPRPPGQTTYGMMKGYQFTGDGMEGFPAVAQPDADWLASQKRRQRVAHLKRKRKPRGRDYG